MVRRDIAQRCKDLFEKDFIPPGHLMPPWQVVGRSQIVAASRQALLHPGFQRVEGQLATRSDQLLVEPAADGGNPHR